MAPLVRRTWMPTGKTPILKHQTRSHKKVSAIAAICISPTREQVHLYFRLHADENINTNRAIAFLKQLLKQLQTPVVLIWDRLLVHRAVKMRKFIEKTKNLWMFFLPPYAPELNPVEPVWSYLKLNPLANFVPSDLQQLTQTARSHTRSLQYEQQLLRAFVKHAALPIRLRH